MNLTKICIEFQRTNESKWYYIRNKDFQPNAFCGLLLRNAMKKKQMKGKTEKWKGIGSSTKFELKTSNISGLKTF